MCYLKMNCYVVSLKEAVDRREHISNEFRKSKLDFIFFDALKPEVGKQALLKIAPSCNLSRLSGGEVACLASHIVLWKKLLDTKQEYFSIFEDDVYLGEGISKIISELVLDLEGIDLIKLETFREKVILGRCVRQIQDRKLFTLNSGHSGTAGYILTKQGAVKLLENLNTKEQIMPADHYMFEEVRKKVDFCVIQVSPGLCIQEKVLCETSELSNSLDQGRDVWKVVKEKRSIRVRFLREIQRFMLRMKLKICAKKVDYR